jgi:hypothetical protein
LPLAAQLAISTGARNIFPAWLAETSAKSLDERLKSLAARLSSMDVDADEVGNLHGAIAVFRKMPQASGDQIGQLAAQAPRAMRFSFVAPRRVEPAAPT